MIIRVAYCLIYILATVGAAHACTFTGYSTVVETENKDADADSARSYSLKEIIVTALRLPHTAARSASPITVLTRRDLQFTNSISLADLLAPLAGVFIKNYGGSSGLKTISQRGLGAEHTVVLINGMRVSNMQNGLVDLGLIAGEEVEQLELVRGGHSAAFGADAVAGVVNAVVGPLPAQRSVRAASSVGSFGYRSYVISGGGELSDALGIRASYREEKGDEDFPFIFRNGNQRFDLVRRNADFISRTGSIQADLWQQEYLHVSVLGRTFSSERGVGGAVVGPTSTSVARQKDEDNLVQLIARTAETGTLNYRLGVQVHHSFQRYEDRNFIIGASALNNFYKNLDLRVEPGLNYTPGENTRLALGGEFARATASGNFLKANLRRSVYAGYVTLQQQMIDEGWIVKNLSVYPALRYDAVTTAEETITSWSPQLGVVCSFQKVGGMLQTTLRASVSRNFRAPTFNELYYSGGGGIGNPNLQPEWSTSVDVGTELTLNLVGTHRLQATYFDITMDNRIVWTAAGTMSVTPKNLRRIRSNGIELSFRSVLFDERLTLGVQYTVLTARKTAEDYPGDRTVGTFLMYVPRESAHYLLGIRLPVRDSWLREVGAAVNTSFVGYRYTTQDNQSFLPSYTIMDANLYTRLLVAELSLLARIEVNNLFNKEYQNVPAYPMPLRSFRASLGIEF